MKKIMFGLAAAIAMVAAADIESSNIVGYTNIVVPQGYSMITPVFKSMTAEAYSVQDIIPMGENVSGDGDIHIQMMDDQGQWIGEYVWYTNDGWGVEDGWYDFDEVLCTEKLSAGQALFVSCDNDGVTFQVAGEVVATAVNAISQGYSMSGNSTPVAINLADVKVIGENVTGDGDVHVQVMDAEGQWIGEYIWYTNDGWGVEDGWYDFDENKVSVELKPGESLFVSSDNEGVSLELPSPIK